MIIEKVFLYRGNPLRALPYSFTLYRQPATVSSVSLALTAGEMGEKGLGRGRALVTGLLLVFVRILRCRHTKGRVCGT